MTTRMVHPLHGATHAYDTGEIDRLKALGWDVEVINAPSCHVPVEVQSASVEAPVACVVERKKPGPKPKAK